MNGREILEYALGSGVLSDSERLLAEGLLEDY